MVRRGRRCTCDDDEVDGDQEHVGDNRGFVDDVEEVHDNGIDDSGRDIDIDIRTSISPRGRDRSLQ